MAHAIKSDWDLDLAYEVDFDLYLERGDVIKVKALEQQLFFRLVTALNTGNSAQLKQAVGLCLEQLENTSWGDPHFDWMGQLKEAFPWLEDFVEEYLPGFEYNRAKACSSICSNKTGETENEDNSSQNEEYGYDDDDLDPEQERGGSATEIKDSVVWWGADI